MLPDSELLRAYVADGSESAFAELVTRHVGTVYRAALRQLGPDKHLAEDVTQAVFTALATKARALGPSVVLAGWLYTTTRYTVANLRRAERRRRARDQELYHMQQHDDAPAPLWEQLRPVLDDALWSLKQLDRDAVLLRFFAQQSYREIATTLRVSEDAARMRVDRALAKLGQRLGERGIVSTAAALAGTLAAQPLATAAPTLAAAVTQRALAASAAAKLSPTASLVHLMATSKAVLAGAGALALLTIGTAVHETLRARSAGLAVAAADADFRAAAASLRAEKAGLAAAERSAANLERRAAASNPSRTAAAPTRAALPSDPVRQRQLTPAEKAGQTFLLRHPEVRTALVEYVDAGTRANYADLYRELRLSDEQIAAFETLLHEGHSFGRTLDNGTVTLTLGPKPSAAEFETRLRTILGDAGYDEYQNFTQTIPARRIAANLASLSVNTDTPLTPETAQKIATLFAASSGTSQHTIDWDAAMADAAQVLTPGQMELLKTLRSRSDEWDGIVAAAH